MSKPKLYLSEGYHMKFDTVASLLQLVNDSNLPTHSKEWVTKNMGVSSRMVKCIANYCSATGLLIPKVYKPTLFGKLVNEYDPYVGDNGTLWLMHYIAASNQELIIWNRLFNTILHEMPTGHQSNEYYHYFDDLHETFTPATIKTNVPSELNSLLNAYSEQQFSKLGIIAKTNDGVYSYKNQPMSIIIFYALVLLYKERNYQGASTMDVSFLCSEFNSPGRVSLYSSINIRRMIEELHKVKLIQLESRADLDQIRFVHNHTFLDGVKMYYRGNHD
ncbi:hypothetical protein BK120_19815 [Paenibacillus sp. FSL A5-0031]|uniref:DUF4007 family protein n=1 Tax=Paenibacillus sp. FSL A5-0031 TaxID=1920420 RepID=UPI00096F6179|nr:DUF4007 family protein [Paenibacillus sp. FSL A5-0031]OME80090.1 hypothetical protein BK120_19815 [Paenibacillus sp. FSL A5-0031]